jgi:bla regulator protein blaR1
MNQSSAIKVNRSLTQAISVGIMVVIALGLPGFPFGHVSAQTENPHVSPTPTLPTLSVISIRPVKTPGGSQSYFTEDGYRGEGVSLETLIKTAYGLDKDYLLSGLPAWGQSVRYQIEAKVDGADVPALGHFTFPERAQMLRPLLVDRFQLKFHWETRTLPVYELTVAKGGSKLKKVARDSSVQQTNNGGSNIIPGTVVTNLDGQTVGTAIPIEMFIRVISPYSDRTIVDRTGLEGNYGFTMQLPRSRSHDVDATMGGSQVGGVDGSAGSLEPPSLSIFTSVEDVGLKLIPHNAPQRVLVIDHIESPTPN